MRGFTAICLVAGVVIQGAMGFVAPSARLRVARRAPWTASSPSRLRMSTTNTPKFSVSLMDETRVSLHLEKENLQNLATQVNNILTSFKRLKANAAEGGKPYKEDTIEFQDTTAAGVNIVMECNPNIFPDPFKAQVFIRIWDDKFEVSSQAMLTKVTDAIKLHMAAIKSQA